MTDKQKLIDFRDWLSSTAGQLEEKKHLNLGGVVFYQDRKDFFSVNNHTVEYGVTSNSIRTDIKSENFNDIDLDVFIKDATKTILEWKLKDIEVQLKKYEEDKNEN